MLSPRICASLRQGIEEEESQQNRQYQYDLEDERTLLDVFGDSVKDVLSHHVIPATDSQCRWSWQHARCEPFCTCALQPQLGDFHLERSCRLRPAVPFTPSDITFTESKTNLDLSTCHLPPDTPYFKLFTVMAGKTKSAAKNTKNTLLQAKFVIQRSQILHKIKQTKTRACHQIQQKSSENKSLEVLENVVCSSHEKLGNNSTIR